MDALKRESKQGKMLTGVDFYMRQHGVSMKETSDKFLELTEDAWKDLNTKWMTSNDDDIVPKDMVELVLNYARVAEFYYRTCQDGYSKPEALLPPIVGALFVHPIII